jgi:hypothetical protein
MDEEKIKRHVIFGDDVGYGKTPQEGQFQKGQSGNPKGRPKKASSTLALTDQPMLSAVLVVANKPVPVRDSGEMTEMSMLEAVVAATAACAVKGNARSQATFIGLAQKAHQAEALQRRESIEFWTEYKGTRSAQLAEANERNSPVTGILPHPDDIVIDYLKGPQFLGPMDEKEQAAVNQTLRYRDVLIMQDALDHRSKIRLKGVLLTEPGSAGLMAMLLEMAIPPRLRLSEIQWLMRAMKYENMPKRDLLKNLSEAWFKLGIPRPRGYLSPNLTWTRNYLAMAAVLLRQIQAGNLDPDRISRDEWDEAIYALNEKHSAESPKAAQS